MRANVGNLVDFEEGSLSNGRHQVEVTKVEHTVSEKKGTEGTVLYLRILDGPEMTDGQPCAGESFITTLWWPNNNMKDSGKYSRKILRKACVAAGVIMDELGFEEQDFLGTVFDVALKIGDYEGEPRPEVKTFYESN
jgi:hypothetical protein